jgi:hypothetical protein
LPFTRTYVSSTRHESFVGLSCRRKRRSRTCEEKPKECLEYVVLHEMVHLLEPTHSSKFIAIMDRFMPHWLGIRGLLNSLPASPDHWEQWNEESH